MLFSEEYRKFLKHANGWPGFYVSVDLFGTTELVDGTALKIRNISTVKDFIESIGLKLNQVVPIGASNHERDVFLLVSEISTKLSGVVIWLSGYEVDRYDNFEVFFDAMLNNNEQIAEQLRRFR